MEIILSVIFILGFIVYFKVQEERAINHSNTHRVDWGKVNDDRIMNDLSNSDVNRNIINGKYDAHVTTNKSSDETWEDFKKRHPHGSWN